MTRTNALLLIGLVAVPFATLPLAAQAPVKPLTVEAIYAQVGETVESKDLLLKLRQ